MGEGDRNSGIESLAAAATRRPRENIRDGSVAPWPALCAQPQAISSSSFRDIACSPGLLNSVHVHQLNFRQRPLLNPVGYFEQTVAALSH
jgi:hypothetical protein